MNEQKAEQQIKEKFKGNLQLLIAFGTVVGLAVGVGNFFILTQLAPIERRVAAIEDRNEKTDPLVTRFIQLEIRDEALVKDVDEIKADIKDIKNFLNIR
jgi:flagellar basal body-associated protein FliL